MLEDSQEIDDYVKAKMDLLKALDSIRALPPHLQQHLAEEIVQEVFVKIIENIDSIGEIDSKRTKNFLCVICRNLAINLYNKNNKEKFLNIEELIYNEAESINDFYDLVVDNDNVITIKQAIAELPEIYRDILVLEKIYGYNVKEISRLINISETVVRKRSQRARKILSNEVGRSVKK